MPSSHPSLGVSVFFLSFFQHYSFNTLGTGLARKKEEENFTAVWRALKKRIPRLEHWVNLLLTVNYSQS